VIGARLVNGVESAAVAADDRGLQYGDGLFETMLASKGRIMHFELHLARLREGCHRLGIPEPDRDLVENDCERVLAGLDGGIVKLVITRGSGPRGYRPPEQASATRIVSSSARPPPTREPPEALRLRICEIRLGLNERLAGIKHLNRLEQVLACAEWNDPSIDEGLMFSADGRLICATAANVFLVSGGRLVTPAVRDCGVAGVMRQAVINTCRAMGVDVVIRDLGLSDIKGCEELFVTSAVRGVRPVGEVIEVGNWSVREMTTMIRDKVQETSP